MYSNFELLFSCNIEKGKKKSSDKNLLLFTIFQDPVGYKFVEV